MPPATNNYILYIFEYHLGLYIAHNYKPDEQNQKICKTQYQQSYINTFISDKSNNSFMSL